VPRALITGGTGAIGSACARRLVAAGWTVEVTGRDAEHLAPELRAAGVQFTSSDRNDAVGLGTLVGSGADLLVDCACRTAAHAGELVELMGSIGSTVMISAKAVYVDSEGRHINSEVPPRFDAPISESQPTLRPDGSPPGTREGYGPNKVAAEEVLLDSSHPVTVLRPSKVHGPWARRPLEWVFLKRVLDRRPYVLLGGRGAGGDHPSSAANIAALIELVAARPGRRVLNIADPDAPRALEIARLIAARLDHTWTEILLDDDADPALGRTPWNLFPPLVLDTAAAVELGYRPVGSYAQTVIDEIDWLVRAHGLNRRGWPLPSERDPYFIPLFDYDAEDRFVSGRSASR
jgi:nucleoside-diphosphate-sugar epimerase